MCMCSFVPVLDKCVSCGCVCLYLWYVGETMEGEKYYRNEVKGDGGKNSGVERSTNRKKTSDRIALSEKERERERNESLCL